MTRIRVTDDDGTRIVELDDATVSLGRSPDCDVQLASGGVSRSHAELVRDKRGWAISDLGSSNGTFVNGDKVERSRVEPGDEVRLGTSVLLELLAEGEAAADDEDEARDEADSAERADGEAVDDAGEDEAPARAGRSKRANKPAGAPAWWQETRWCLRGVESDDLIELSAERTTVGREEGAGIVIEDASVSRVHARLDVNGAQLMVTDLKSGNGTFVGAERVLSRPVGPGDHVRFGDVEYVIERRQVFAASRVGRPLAIALVLLVVGAVGWWGSLRVLEWERSRRVGEQFRAQAVEALHQGVQAAEARDTDIARGHFRHAADLLILSGIAPEGSSLEKPGELFRGIAPELPPAEREFDFASVFKADAIRQTEASLATMTTREYVEHELKRYCAELGQDANLPPEFVEQVWAQVQEFQAYPAGMKQMLRRAQTVEPRIVAVLARHRLPAMVSYVAWVESELDPTRESPAHAVGLWQLMEATARENGLHVEEGNDERTDVEKSTQAAARYIATMLKDQGPEYFMLVLASYNRGHNALSRVKQQVDDPMLSSTRKYWYLVERKKLPEETRNYVPKILAVRLIAEAPGRFGF